MNERHEHENANLAALRPLLTAMFDGGLTDAQWQQLRRIIAADRVARREYVRYVSLHGQLQGEIEWQQGTIAVGPAGVAGGVGAAVDADADAEVEVIALIGGAGGRPWAIAAAVAAAVSIAAWVMLTMYGGAPVEPEAPPPTGRPVAVLIDTRDVRWGPGVEPLDPGESVVDRPMAIESGRLSLDLQSGVSLTVEGPARFTVRSDRHLDLRHGSVVSHVPPGVDGYRVTAPGVTVTDLGTEFGVIVDESGATRVLVIDGRVEVAVTDAQGRARSKRQVTAGQGVAHDTADTDSLRDLRPGEVVFGRGYPLNVDPPMVRSMLAANPIAYWPLSDRPDAMSVLDRSAGGLHGVIYGEVSLGGAGPLGESPGLTSAASFGGAGYIDMGQSAKLGALSDSFSVAAYARLTASSDVERLISVDSRVSGKRGGWGVGVKKDAKTGALIPRFTLYSVLDYDFVESPLPRDRWVHLAFVIDERFAVTLYVDGERRQTLRGRGGAMTGVYPVQIAQMAEGTERVHGSIAHVAVFDRILSENEIVRVFKSGEKSQTP